MEDLKKAIKALEQDLASNKFDNSGSLLQRAKISLLHQNALVPSTSADPQVLAAAVRILELGALTRLRVEDLDAFMRLFQQLQGFYHLSKSCFPSPSPYESQRSKITGIYLLLLLIRSDYAGFHTLIESLESEADEAKREGGSRIKGIDEDELIQYPIRLESWLMEGSYDRIGEETQNNRVPCEEFGYFSQVLMTTVRSEIASCSEKAYGSIPLRNAKSLFFLESEGDVVRFTGKQPGWQTKDGRIYFPEDGGAAEALDLSSMSNGAIENTLGYARQLETIV